jgi:hypothetical protein
MAETLLRISSLLPLIACLLLLRLWWPHRKTQLLSSVPWICILLIYWSVPHSWMKPIFTDFARAMESPAASNVAVSQVLIGRMVAIPLSYRIACFLIALMTTINCAFLLRSISPNRFNGVLADQHRFQPVLGVLLLISGIAPLLVTLYCTYLLDRG